MLPHLSSKDYQRSIKKEFPYGHCVRIQSPTRRLADWLKKQIPSTSKISGLEIRNRKELLDIAKILKLNNHEIMVSFDVKSLFTNINRTLALKEIREYFEVKRQDCENKGLEINEMIEGFRLCLDNIYFRYGNKFYKQKDGTAMGCPTSMIIADIVMASVDKKAILIEGIRIWGRYIDDVFAVIRKENLNEIMGDKNDLRVLSHGEIGIDGILGLPGFRALKLHLSYDGSIRSDYERKEDPTKSAFLSSLQTIEMSPQPPRIPLNEIHTGHDIFRAFSHCFCNDIKDMGNGSTITAPKLRMLTSKPVYRRQYPIPNKLVSKVKALVDELEEVGIVEGSTSLWNSPLFPVAKTDGSVRITMDLRMINEATEFFPFPIPRVEDNLRAFAGAKVFSTLDLTSGFFQIHIPESDRDYFTFSLPWGRYRFTRLPQGAKNSAQVFQWAMNLVLGDLLFKCVRLYIDDVIVYSDSHEQHVADLVDGLLPGMYGGMSNIPVPAPILINSQAAENWRFFKSQWDNYQVATELNKKDNNVIRATFLSFIGKDCFNVFLNLDLKEDEKNSLPKIIEALDNHFTPQKNVIYERYIFNTSNQEENEGIDSYTNRLRGLASSCEYDILTEELIRDRIVLGIKDNRVRKKLLMEPKLNLSLAIDICRTAEVTEQQITKLTGQESEDVKWNRKYERKKEATKATNETFEDIINCHYCGSKHRKASCPAYGKICTWCNRKNHFSKVCRLRIQKPKQMNVRAIQEQDESSDEAVLQLRRHYAAGNIKKHKWMVKLLFETANQTVPLECQLDSGSTCNIMSLDEYRWVMQERSNNLDISNARLENFGGVILKPVGQKYLDCYFKEKKYNLLCQIVNINQKPLLSAKTIEDLNLVTKHDAVYHLANSSCSRAESIINKYEDVFKGLGMLPKEYHIEIEKEATPVQQHPRRIPIGLKAEFKRKLDDLEGRGIIERVQKSSSWISNLVLVKKQNKLRVCLDPRDLNKVIKRPHFRIPIIDEILPSLNNAKIFTVIDAKDGFWQVKLDSQSSDLTTFWTPFGRYKWLRMPFGISAAPEEFQRRLHEVIEGLEGVEVIADDILVFGKGNTTEDAIRDHNIKLEKLLMRARERNLKFNKDKIRLCSNHVNYMGHILSDEGLRPDPGKVEAIKAMSRPQNVREIQQYLGCINYLTKFLPRISEVVQPLRVLTQKCKSWSWSEPQEQAFMLSKELVTQAPVLKYFDPSLPVTIQSDASDKGLGAVLLQGEQPVAYASKALTNTETRYAQIEKECLSIVFACEHFYQYIAGGTK
ncbi:K02A2.6-like, partial [Cordylochernes scorpioides]